MRLRVNPIVCSGHGLCAELLPERISMDEWGYPIVSGAPVPAGLRSLARRAVTDCPVLALLADGPDAGASEEYQRKHRAGAWPRGG